ncbi:UNVERIFIED_CONTAM: hypothetical protein HDU68_004601, partial [Siphonaria sp. JEL0065]
QTMETPNAITVSINPSVRVASLRAQIESFMEQGGMWKQLHAFLNESNVVASGPTLMVLHGQSDPIDVEVCVPIAASVVLPTHDKITTRDLPEETIASLKHQGPMNDVGSLYPRLKEWIGNSGFVASGPSREVYLELPAFGSPTSAYNNCSYEVQFPIKEKPE